MTASEYKSYKGIRKENLRDNMTRLEVILTDLGEATTEELAKEYKPQGLEENKKIARMGGNTAKVARNDIEKKLHKPIITKDNNLNYQYLEENKYLEGK